ncbi:uncharacterized protein LOC129586822 isoform X2 [Paramacrobiotus metropolitanus]|nr:uncharacterized protein LOC129586822 isoform X2 [Paramacrobiotus metropolitanus]
MDFHIKKEKNQQIVASQEKEMFFQEVEQLSRRIKNNASALLVLGQDLSHANDEFRSRTSVNKQKLKNLMSEQYNQSFFGKIEELGKFPGKFENNWQQEQTAYESLMHSVQNEINKRQTLDNFNRELRLGQLSKMQTKREEFVATQETLIDTFEHYTELLRKSTENGLKDYIRKTDDDKAFCITYMLEIQAKNLNNLRNYFQDIVASNADIINELKKQVDSRHVALERVERATYSALEELSRYREPMQQIEAEIVQCEKILSTSKAVREGLSKLHLQKRLLADEVKRLGWIKEIEQTKIEKCNEELAQIQQSYYETKFSITQKAAQSSLIHSKASALISDEASMYEITYAILKDLCGFSPSAVADSRSIVEAVLARDTERVNGLLMEASALKKKYNELWDSVSHAFQQKTKMTLDAVGFRIPDLNLLSPII